MPPDVTNDTSTRITGTGTKAETKRESPPDNDRGRPLAEAASHVGHHDDHSSVGVRCRECGHPLTARRSVERGIGPVCARRSSTGADLSKNLDTPGTWEAAIAEVIACAA